MTARFRAVLFDLDGTLADTLADIAGAVNGVLHARGFHVHPVADYLAFVGEGAERLVSRALPSDQQALVPAVLAEYRDAYAGRLTQETRLYPGIGAMLDGLTRAGITIAILSNKQDELTRGVAQALLSGWPFRIVQGERVGVPRKPDPTSALDIARRLEIPPGEMAFVGDTPIDMKTASAAGMYGIGVSWGFRGHDELVEAGARVVVTRAEQILDVVCPAG